MKNIVIAAGYATRLGELTKNFPKPLLKIGENTILGRMLDDIDRISEIDEHIIISNHRFAPIFDKWKMEDGRWKKPITIVDDGTETNDTRLGAVCDLLFAMDKLHIDDDLLVVAADNLLFFSFQEFVDFAKEKQTSCIMCHEQPSIEKLQRNGFDVALRLSPFIPGFIDFDRLNAVECDKILVEFLRVNPWIEKWLGMDCSEWTVKHGGYRHLPLERKIDFMEKIRGFREISVCEDEDEAYGYWKANVNHNPDDCCNLRRADDG